MKELPDLMKCDVADKETLALYRKCVKDWTEILLGEDVHSIKNQLNEFVFHFALFRCYRKAMDLSYPEESYPEGYNHHLLVLFQNCFLESHIMSIRRFIDDNYHDPNRKVFSLVRICDEIIENASLITRENYVCFDGLPFEQVSDSLDNWRENHDRNFRNILFSTLCKDPTGSRNDTIDLDKAKQLRKQIVGLSKIRNFANKFFAHAADPKTRKNEVEYNFISIEDIEKSQQVIFNVVHGLGKFIGDISLTELPSVLFDQFENWDRPIVKAENLEEVRSYWRELTTQQDREARAMRDVNFSNWNRSGEV